MPPAKQAGPRGRLIFVASPIREAVVEVSRYSDRKIELKDASIARISVSGIVDTGDTDAFIAALAPGGPH